ncbi:unnamed protein product [Cochlearia groenlandica]
MATLAQNAFLCLRDPPSPGTRSVAFRRYRLPYGLRWILRSIRASQPSDKIWWKGELRLWLGSNLWRKRLHRFVLYVYIVFKQIGPDQIEALYQYAKFQFECGNYSGDYLYQYKTLCSNLERSLSALWGKLASEILMQNWDIAVEELNCIKEMIDSKVIQQEHYSYKDPIIEFLACVFVNYDFDGAQKKRKECEEVIVNDPFFGKRVEDGNFSTVPLKDEFLENGRLFVFETCCKIHQRIDMGHEQLINHTKALSGRTCKLVTQLLEHTQGQAAP